MKILDPRELATIRAALSLWSRSARPSPHLVQQASGGDQFPPLDDGEIATLQEKLRDARVSIQPVDDDIADLVRKVAALDDYRRREVHELIDEAQAIVGRLDD